MKEFFRLYILHFYKTAKQVRGNGIWVILANGYFGETFGTIFDGVRSAITRLCRHIPDRFRRSTYIRLDRIENKFDVHIHPQFTGSLFVYVWPSTLIVFMRTLFVNLALSITLSKTQDLFYRDLVA
jgi:hypothetical protein